MHSHLSILHGEIRVPILMIVVGSTLGLLNATFHKAPLTYIL